MNHFHVSVSVQTGVVKTGGFRYDDGTRYIGDWNQKGQKHGMGHLLLPDGTRYGEFNIFLWSSDLKTYKNLLNCYKMDLL
jgi:hypothetical protein